MNSTELARQWLLLLQRQKKEILFGKPLRKGFSCKPSGLINYTRHNGRIFFTTPRVKVRPRNSKPWQLEMIRERRREYIGIWDV